MKTTAHRGPFLILAVMLLSACSSPSSTNNRKPGDPRSTKETARAGSSGRQVGEGEILRSELRRHLKRGAGEFISRVGVRAEFRRNRFFGWRVVSYRGPGKKIRAGDIITRVNNKPIERPNQFMAVWNMMSKSDSLVVKLVRNRKPMVLRYKIVD